MRIILGPPGTGKTTRLLDLVNQYMEAGVPADRIGYFAFTRRAAKEARDRAMDRFMLSHSDLPYFKTLHSLAYSALGINNQRLMNRKHYEEVSKMVGVPFVISGAMQEGPFLDLGYKDKCLEVIQMARITNLPLMKVYAASEVRHSTDFSRVQRVAKGLRYYKDVMELFDYTDMLEQFVHRQLAPKLELLVIDEAQDLSPIQWRMVEHLASRAKDTYVAGDDDQAIYRWAGADVKHFINVEGQVEVLSQSYRIPVLHHTLSQKVLRNIRDRRPKHFEPRGSEGVVQRYRHADEVDLSEGSWLLLARTQRQAKVLQGEVEQRGFVYATTGGQTIDMEIVRAVSTWEKLRKGMSVRAHEVRKVYALMEKNQIAYGSKTLPNVEDNTLLSMQDLRNYHGLLHDLPWDQGLKKIPEEKRRYLLACMRRGEDLAAEPRITVSTIHGAKGAEADNVLLTTDSVGNRIAKLRHSDTDHEDEHRVWYVGLTRAKQTLHLINPQKKGGYDVPH